MTDTVEIITVPDVEIVSTGTWRLSTGIATFTAADLADAVAASYDPGFSNPRAKKGHVSDEEAFHCTSCGGVCVCGAEPACGYYANLRLSDDGQTIIGDHVVRSDIAATLPSDYPSRSFEGYHDITSPATNREYSLVISAVALLGVAWPAIADLNDLSATDVAAAFEAAPLAAAYATDANAHKRAGGRPFRAHRGDPMQFPKRKTKLTAQIDNEDIRREFNADIGDRQDLWIRGHLRDPDELVVENWDGTTLYKVAYTITGTDVEFGDLREQQLTDVPEVLAARSGRLVASYNRPESRPANTTQEGQMDRDAIVSLLELPAETTDEQAQEALTKARGAVTSTDPVVDTEAEETNTVDEADPIAATLKLPEGYTAVKIDRLGKLEASIADLDKTRKAQLLAARDSEAKTWLNEGRISKDELDDAVALNRTDQKLAASIFGSRAKGTVPVDGERGTSADNEGRSDRLAAAMAIHRGGKTVTNTKGA